MEFVKRKLTKQQLNFMYNASKNQVEEFLKKTEEEYIEVMKAIGMLKK